ncbi:monooxygenase FAD-binding protein [Calothrix sp. NIES-4071]|nr:monooxygenase FAD-binding protein [Calothrix sp. NIES-4071]BAZ64299.1 monooxygenase FAD-binding protein [Calothrix sp. NIES-4105]
MNIYDVVIVGAGPVGLATALGLRQRGIENILVVDQTRAFRRVGQVVDLLPNGLKAVKYIDSNAYEAVKKIYFSLQKQPSKPSSVWVYKDLQGNNVHSTSLSFDYWFEKYGEGRVSVAWYDLQTALRQLLPENIVVINNRCIDIQEEDNCVRINCVSDATVNINPYAYWEEGNLEAPSQQFKTQSFRAKLVVAADGINSTVRKVIYKNISDSALGEPEYSGFAAVFCSEITEISNQLKTQIEEKYLNEGFISTIGNHAVTEQPRLMLFRRDDSIGYILHSALPLKVLENKSGTSLVEITSQEVEKVGFPLELKQLVNLSPAVKMQQRPYYIHHATNSTWSKGRTVLVGDAAHGMPPFMAQGANQGFEDALAITTQITNIAQNNNWDNIQAITQCFQTYEKYRRPFMEYIQHATLTRFPLSSEKLSQEYSQKVYSRNLDSTTGVML